MAEQNQIITFKSDGVVSPEQACREILVALNANAGAGTAAAVRAGSPVFNDQGKLVRVEIIPPDAAAADKVAAALQHAGVAEIRGCSPQLVIMDLNVSGPDGLVVGGGFPALIANQSLQVQAVNSAALYGFLNNAGYTDNAPGNLDAVKLIIVNSTGVADMVIPIGATVTLNLSATSSITYTFTKALTLKLALLGGNLAEFFLDDQGNLIARRISAGSGGTPNLPTESDYLVACEDPLRAF